jgi:hypothetical protein
VRSRADSGEACADSSQDNLASLHQDTEKKDEIIKVTQFRAFLMSRRNIFVTEFLPP